MDRSPNTLFLRLEGALQAWGNNESKFVIRRTADAPTKSGVFGLLCAALGVTRLDAEKDWLPQLQKMRMGVRIDRPGIRWWDYHTVGAGQEMRKAGFRQSDKISDPIQARKVIHEPDFGNKIDMKMGPILTRREYLADGSFLVALQGDPHIVDTLFKALQEPVWTVFLGRKSCPPSRLIWEHEPGYFESLEDALRSIPLQKREDDSVITASWDVLLDWMPAFDGDKVPDDIEIHYDIPLSFQPPNHAPRYVIRKRIGLGPNTETQKVTIGRPWTARRIRADYGNREYRRVRAERLVMDHSACMFCKAPATTVQHVSYSRAGGREVPEDLRALCRICHDACTMLEYGAGMGNERIDPSDPAWRDAILAKRNEIIEYHSRAQHSRKLQPKKEQT
ncbi:MAG: type I-E CRISPR-associated protein Cas5/CasD [Candidatus Cloacimonetes bacterium]|nr:type I-E CRISPR-associated protein Cas5/CasD [Candidatus Cloacimonadota bacterium]NLO12101.1 type I-E CRISPR-associated protein Cas5/CasD [Candidatus Cloacimonadota bacterium]